MIKLLKQLFCNHNYTVERWRWTYGDPTENHTWHIAAELSCMKCGKKTYLIPDPCSDLEIYILSKYADKQC